MNKKLLMSILATSMAYPMFADNSTGLSAVAEQSGNVATYMTFVQAVCYSLAGVIAIVGAVAAYYVLQSNNGNASKVVMATVGSCITFVCMATSLPMFFGYDGEGSFTHATNGTTGNGSGSTVSPGGGIANGNSVVVGNGGVPQSGIITVIPPLSDPIWTKNPNSGTFTKNWMQNNGDMNYPSLLDNARTDAFQSGNSRGEQALSNYESDVEFLLSYNDGDWSKAVKQAESNISWAYEAERNMEPLPYSHRDYENILQGLLTVYRYMHGYDYVP